MSDLVPALTKFREAQQPKLTLEALAAQVGVSVGWLSRVERNGTANFKLALKLAEITGLPAEAFAPRELA
jgi:transcriptional regulator with XRE-family HTH domain